MRTKSVIAVSTLTFGLALTAGAWPSARADGCCGGGGAAAAENGEGGHGGHGGGAKGAKPADGSGGATTDSPAAKSDAATPLIVALGNPKCPVMGGDAKPGVYSDWNGLRVSHCCPMCKGKFAANPEKLLDAAKIEWKAAAEAVRKYNAAKGPDREKALAAIKEKWNVVSEPAATPVAAPAAAETLVDLGNAKCPVRGGAVDGKTYTEWNGLRVGHCCPGCSAKFLTDPEKSLDAAKLSWREAADAVKAVEKATGADRAKALDALKKKWKLLREPAAPAAK